MRKAELMAPAGSYEAFTAAIQAGADSIYFGVEQLNMRAKSTMNFTIEDLPKIARIAKKFGVKTYLAVNTIMYDHDISLMKRIISAAKDSGIDAVIVSDQAAIMYAHSIKMPVHISTQVNISNVESVKFYSHFADVMVLARELTLKQVEYIIKQIEKQDIRGPSGELVKIEIFAHGALCMAISGKCYLSLHSHNSSANRGACVQNCRRPYEVKDLLEGVTLRIENEYIMSPKDLCTLPFLDKVLQTGVSVLKIEGRGRAADYVYTTTKVYKEAIEAYYNNEFTKDKVELWMKELRKVYNRGFWDGYYLGRKLGEWSETPGSQASRKKVFVAKGVKYFPKIQVAHFKMLSHSLKQGDKVLIIGPKTGVLETEIKELWVNNKVVPEVKKGEDFTIKLPRKIRPSDKLYKLVPA